jgi:chorismate-pyruvate lyase
MRQIYRAPLGIANDRGTGLGHEVNGSEQARADRGEALVRRRFVMQHLRPPELRRLDVAALDAVARTLLFTDGTLVGALEAHALERVRVALVDQRREVVPAPAAACLQLGHDAEAVRRRVAFTIAARATPGACAESLILMERLPRAFPALLAASEHGIGEALAAADVEHRRELLWCGLGASPAWLVPPLRGATLARAYRITTGGHPAILVSERFALRRRGGRYRLCG